MIGVYGEALRVGIHRALPRDEPLTMRRCHSFLKPWKGGNSSMAKPIT